VGDRALARAQVAPHNVVLPTRRSSTALRAARARSDAHPHAGHARQGHSGERTQPLHSTRDPHARSDAMLHSAAAAGDADALASALGAGAPVDERDEARASASARAPPPRGADAARATVCAAAQAGNTALHVAAALPTPAPVVALLSAGADVNARNAARETPLLRCVDAAPLSLAADTTVASLLIAAGADVNAVAEARARAERAGGHAHGCALPLPPARCQCMRFSLLRA
jgi:ankyrin repeat protein